MFDIYPAKEQDAADILELQRLAYQSEAALYNDWSIPPLTQSLESLLVEFETSDVLKAVSDTRLVGSVRAKVSGGICAIGRLIVHPEFQGRGIGTRLLAEIEAQHLGATRYELFTGSKSEANIRLYQRLGYKVNRTQMVSPAVSLVFLEKPGVPSNNSFKPTC